MEFEYHPLIDWKAGGQGELGWAGKRGDRDRVTPSR